MAGMGLIGAGIGVGEAMGEERTMLASSAVRCGGTTIPGCCGGGTAALVVWAGDLEGEEPVCGGTGLLSCGCWIFGDRAVAAAPTVVGDSTMVVAVALFVAAGDRDAPTVATGGSS